MITLPFYGRSYVYLNNGELNFYQKHLYSCSEKIEIYRSIKKYDTININSDSLSDFSLNCWGAQLLASEILLKQNREREARKLLNLAIDSNPNNPKILIFLTSNFKHSAVENFVLCNKIKHLDKVLTKFSIVDYPELCV